MELNSFKEQHKLFLIMYIYTYLGISYLQRPAELGFSCSVFNKIEKSPTQSYTYDHTYIADYLVVD